MTEYKKAIRNIVIVIVAVLILIPCSLFLFEVIKSSGAEKVEFYYMMITIFVYLHNQMFMEKNSF